MSNTVLLYTCDAIVIIIYLIIDTIVSKNTYTQCIRCFTMLHWPLILASFKLNSRYYAYIQLW